VPLRARTRPAARTAVLVATTRLDPHADAVMDALDRCGCEAFRLHPEDFLTDYRFSFAVAETGWNLALADALGRKIDLEALRVSGYLRKPRLVAARPELKKAFHRRFAEDEAQAALRALLRLPGIRWFPDPDAVRRGSIKLLQLVAAREAGLAVPQTVVTTDPDVAVAFVRAQPTGAVCKRVGTSPVDNDGNHLVLYTALVQDGDLDLLAENVCQAPTLLQELIPKRADLRVVVVGETLFACEIDSQSDERARLDWRVADPFELPHQIVELPDEVSAAVRRFVGGYGLEFSVIDLAVTPHNRYVFFENNPNGQWYWLELMTGAPTAECVARQLVQLATRPDDLADPSRARPTRQRQ
jgi:glutathione synthase/RimK-type ligase-like ATP-grasp enzyme